MSHSWFLSDVQTWIRKLNSREHTLVNFSSNILASTSEKQNIHIHIVCSNLIHSDSHVVFLLFYICSANEHCWTTHTQVSHLSWLQNPCMKEWRISTTNGLGSTRKMYFQASGYIKEKTEWRKEDMGDKILHVFQQKITNHFTEDIKLPSSRPNFSIHINIMAGKALRTKEHNRTRPHTKMQ